MIRLALLASLTIACQREADKPALPTATDWGGASAPSGGDPHGGMGGGDPHAGVDMGGGGDDPHAGLDMGGGGDDPHAGLDMGGGGDPHAGLDMGGAAGDPAMAAMQPPDPTRPIDRSRFLRGRIAASPAAKEKIKPGAILFLSVKPIDPASGEVIGAPLAVDRLDLASLPVGFSLDESHTMVAGTEFTGEVVISARVDGDGEARSRQPGDVEGSVRARIPADRLELVLDQIVR